MDVALFSSVKGKRGQEYVSRTPLDSLVKKSGVSHSCLMLWARRSGKPSRLQTPRKANERCETVKAVMLQPNVFTFSR